MKNLETFENYSKKPVETIVDTFFKDDNWENVEQMGYHMGEGWTEEDWIKFQEESKMPRHVSLEDMQDTRISEWPSGAKKKLINWMIKNKLVDSKSGLWLGPKYYQ